jgi:cellulose synthase/poly-beta-1,6-N-acetylglucosamine synthase-like glycosyltransferase
MGAGLLTATVFSPHLLDAALALNLVLLVGVLGLQLGGAVVGRRAARLTRPPPARRWDRQPFVSVHLPVCNEPPEVVLETLLALSRLEWGHYEVIVLDNNTRDEGLWRPVAAACGRLGPAFAFSRVPELAGGRAAALEACRRLTHDAAELVLVVDADCRVQPDLLTRSARYFDSLWVGLVQFPEARAAGAPGITSERALHLESLAAYGEAEGVPVCTGGVSLLQRRALDDVGGYDAAAHSPDVDLALRLLRRGWRARYAPEAAGEGHVPGDVMALSRQRRRRAYGHAQALLSLEGADLSRFGARRTLALVAQLSAVHGFLLLPALALASLPFVPGAAEAHGLALLFAAVSFWAFMAGKLAFLFLAPPVRGEPRAGLRALAAHLALSWESNAGWLEALLRAPGAGGRTSKFRRRERRRALLVPLALVTALGTAALAFAADSSPGLALSSTLAAAMFAAVLYARRETAAMNERAPARVVAANARLLFDVARPRPGAITPEVGL